MAAIVRSGNRLRIMPAAYPEPYVSGFIAWWLWRTIYLSKLPRFEKKLRVALDWTLDLLFSKDIVQFVTFRAPTVSHEIEDGRGHSLAATSGPVILSRRTSA